MEINNQRRISMWLTNEDRVYTFFCTGLAFSIILLPFLNSILSAGLFLYWLFFSKKVISVKTTNTKWATLFCSLFLLVIIGTFYSEDLRQALSRIEKKAPLLFFPLIFSSAVNVSTLIYKRTIQGFIIATFTGCLICIGYGLFIFIQTAESAQLHGYQLIVLKQMSPAIMSFCCLLSLLFLFNNFIETKVRKAETKKWIILTFMFAIIFIFLLLLSNRIALFITGGLFIFYIFKLISKKRHRLLALFSFVIILLASIMLNPSLQQQWKDLTDFSESNTIPLDQDKSLGRGWGGKALRVTIWKCSWDIIKQNWLIGVGTGDVQNSLQDAYEKRQFYFASRYNRYDAHNQYIQQLLANGIIGLLAFLSCILAPLVYFIKQKQNSLYCLFILCFAFACITESLLEVSKGVILYSFFNSLLFFKYSNNPPVL